MLSGTLKQKKKTIMDGTGWCPPSLRTLAMNARSSEQLQARLKDMPDCPKMATFKSDAAASDASVFMCACEHIPEWNSSKNKNAWA